MADEVRPPVKHDDAPGQPRCVTSEVDTSTLFDMLARMKGETQDLGQRLVEALPADPGFATAVGMAAYGVSSVNPRADNPPAQERAGDE
jgi:hypothetical protein